MKKPLSGLLALLLLSATGSSMAWWSDNDHGPWGGGDWNPYDEWDPRYWMEEMENEWDDDDDYYRRGYGAPYGGYGYGAPYGGYGYGAPYGGYGAPYGGGYGAPYGGGYGAPYGGGYAPAPAAPTQSAPSQAPSQAPY
jgi:hypothetical protein